MKRLLHGLEFVACLYGGACGVWFLVVVGLVLRFGLHEPDWVEVFLGRWFWVVGAVGGLYGAFIFFRSERKGEFAHSHR